MEPMRKMTHKMKIEMIYKKINSIVKGEAINLRECNEYIQYVKGLSMGAKLEIWRAEYAIQHLNLLILLKENKKRIMKWKKEKKDEGRFTEKSHLDTDIRSFFTPARR